MAQIRMSIILILVRKQLFVIFVYIASESLMEMPRCMLIEVKMEYKHWQEVVCVAYTKSITVIDYRHHIVSKVERKEAEGLCVLSFRIGILRTHIEGETSQIGEQGKVGDVCRL